MIKFIISNIYINLKLSAIMVKLICHALFNRTRTYKCFVKENIISAIK